MRKYLGLGLTAFLVVGLVSFASGRTDIQTITAKVTPSSLDKKEFKSAKIYIDIVTLPDDEVTPGFEQPPSAVRTQVDFPDNLKFDTKAAANCNVDSDALDGSTTKQAIKLCGKGSIVSKTNNTSAKVQVGSPTPGGGSAIIDVTVTAFNGNKPNTLYLHARADDVSITNVLTGKLKKGPKGYKTTLDVTVPPLPAGAISDFRTTVKKGSYVQARCKQKTATYQARTTYSNHEPTEATDKVVCKQKSSQKGGKGSKGGKGGKGGGKK